MACPSSRERHKPRDGTRTVLWVAKEQEERDCKGSTGFFAGDGNREGVRAANKVGELMQPGQKQSRKPAGNGL